VPKKALTISFTEADMFPPIKAFFESLDYSINAEVKGCDIVLVKNDELILIELKKSFNITLLYQAMARKKAASQVYVAIPRPKKVRDKNYRAMLEILSKLEIGLILVAMDSPTRIVSIASHPPAIPGSKALKPRERVLREISGRTNDTNIGGVSKTKIMTAYREKCIQLACALYVLGKPQTAAHLQRKYACPINSNGTMKNCAYGWFKFLGNALFELSPKGKSMIESGEFDETVQFYLKDMRKRHECE